MLHILASIVVLTLASLYLYFLHKFRYWGRLHVPHCKPSFPSGNMQGAGSTRSPCSVFQHLYDSHPGERFLGIWTLCVPVLLLRDPDLIKQILVKDFTHFHDRGIYVNEKDDPLGAHLFAIGGSQWRSLRAKMTPTFTSGRMKLMFPTLVDCANEMVSVLTQPASLGQVIDFKDLSARFTTDVISTCAFGIQTNSLRNPDAEFRTMSRRFFQRTWSRSISVFVSFFAPQIARILGVRRIPEDTTRFFINAVQETMEYRERTKTTRNDFMQLLIQLKNKGKLDEVDDRATAEDQRHEFTILQAAANAFVFFVAGFETSSTTAQFALYELSLNQEVQKRTRDEILHVLSKHGKQMTYESLQDMPYLQRVIDETLRKYPPVPVLHRECTKTYKIPDSGVVIERGMQVQVPIHAIHNDPKYYPQPEMFQPDRFTEHNKTARHHCTYLPFGEGPRNCIGMRFGQMQTKVALISLLSNFRFTLAENTQIPITFDKKSSLFLSPEGEVNLRITKL